MTGHILPSGMCFMPSHMKGNKILWTVQCEHLIAGLLTHKNSDSDHTSCKARGSHRSGYKDYGLLGMTPCSLVDTYQHFRGTATAICSIELLSSWQRHVAPKYGTYLSLHP